MLAAHRDQENRVLAHQVPTKQQLNKTPSARYPKTPSRFPQHDENAPTAFAGKTGLGGANGKSVMKSNGARQALVTPLGTKSRAPLGNKTTNAKARAGQASGGKGTGKDMDKSQLKPTTNRPKQRSVDVTPLDFKVKAVQKALEDEEEPEYAPPRPKDLPYESDVFPRDMLTFEGLKKENVMKGYYEHFFNPVDDNGVSKQEKDLQKTMKKLMTTAEERNQREMDALTWNVNDLDDAPIKQREPVPTGSKESASSATERRVRKKPSTLASRRAASALSMHSDTAKSTKSASAVPTSRIRKPLSSLLQGKRPLTRNAVYTRPSSADSAVGEAASRTTLGYSKGRSASSMIHGSARGAGGAAQSRRPLKSAETISSLSSDLTVTPARLRQAAQKEESRPRPQFTSIFDPEDDDEDLPAINGPLLASDDEEEFEMKFDI